MNLRALALALPLFVFGCQEDKTLAQSMTGSFVREEPALLGLATKTATLEVVPTGMTMRSAGMGVEMTGGITSGQGRISDSSTTSVLFRRVSCDGSSTCSFAGADCEGTISREGGTATIIATGSCAPLSGKWQAR